VPPSVTQPDLMRRRIKCARIAGTAVATAQDIRRERVALEAFDCYRAIARQRPQIVVPLLDSVLARSAESARDVAAVRVRFALASALRDRGQDGDEARALVEAHRARQSCDRIPQTSALAKEIDAWIAAAASP